MLDIFCMQHFKINKAKWKIKNEVSFNLYKENERLFPRKKDDQKGHKPDLEIKRNK